MLNDDGIAARDFLGILMTRKVLALLSEVSRNSTNRTKMIAEQENNFWKDCGKGCSSTKFLKDNSSSTWHGPLIDMQDQYFCHCGIVMSCLTVKFCASKVFR